MGLTFVQITFVKWLLQTHNSLNFKKARTSDETIISKFYLDGYKKIMLDRDLTQLYGVKTKALKTSCQAKH